MPQTDSFQLRPFHSKAGSLKHTLVEMHQLTFVCCFHFRNAVDAHCKQYDPFGKRDKQYRSANIKHCMNRTDLCLVDDSTADGRIYSRKQKHRKHTEYDCTNQVKHQMHITNAFRIFARTDTTEDCRYTGTDILTHDNEHCRIKRHKP